MPDQFEKGVAVFLANDIFFLSPQKCKDLGNVEYLKLLKPRHVYFQKHEERGRSEFG